MTAPTELPVATRLWLRVYAGSLRMLLGQLREAPDALPLTPTPPEMERLLRAWEQDVADLYAGTVDASEAPPERVTTTYAAPAGEAA